jgi:type II secretory pathway pseudopilin PulG
MAVRGQATGKKALPKCETPANETGGFIMVALLVSMAVTAVWMTAALPSWRQQVTREKEAELVFRGEAIARAIFLYQRRNGGAYPPSLDVLVSQKFLRKKYKDPITDKEFLTVVGMAGGVPGAPQAQPGPGRGGIVGVRSTSAAESIRIYNNQQTYSQWAFDFTLEQLRSGATGGAPVNPQGGRGGPGNRGGGPPGPGGAGRTGGIGNSGRGGLGGPSGGVGAPGETNPIRPGAGGPPSPGGAASPPFGIGGNVPGGRGR